MSGFFGIGANVEQTANELAANTIKLADALTSGGKGILTNFTSAFINASYATCPEDVTKYDWATVIAAICWRESRGGSVLRPSGPNGTGDFANRWRYAIPAYAKELDLVTGRYKDGPRGKLFEIRPPAYGVATVRGWGYGLMQIDFASNRDWLDSNDWADPEINIMKGAEILREAYDNDAIKTLKQSIASYNAGVHAVLNADNPDDVTTGGDYSTDVIATAQAFGLSAEALS